MSRSFGLAKPPSLRVITGRLKNRRIIAPAGLDTRPSLEKTRGVIFDALGSRVDFYQFQVADLFAGSGALGIEAYSRGAEPVWFCENGGAYGQLEKNLQGTLPESAYFLLRKNALSWLKQMVPGQRPWLFLLDPPYHKGLGQRALQLLSERSQEFSRSWVVLESGAEEVTIEYPGLEPNCTKQVGKSRLDFFEIP